MTSIGTGYDLATTLLRLMDEIFKLNMQVKARRERWHFSRYSMQGWSGPSSRESRHIQATKARRKQEDCDDRQTSRSCMVPDGHHFVDRARDEARAWRETFKTPISTSDLASRMGGYLQAYTLYQSVRPFGITAIVGGFDSELEAPVDGEVGSGPSVGAGGKVEGKKHGGPGLYMIEPSGMYWGYYGAATGKGRQAAKAELEKLNLTEGTLDLKQAVKEAARIIYVAQQDNKDKEFELEMSWISGVDGPTKGRHQDVPKDLLEEAERLAKKALSEDDEEEEEEKSDDKMEE
ncbi:putative proteasome subunit alpha type-7 [Daldinia childiae]|uniref:putative proteasome subunit alpha type-7 n=1 Tax=Daldinia childiae TaxID=326645 RepID=UPI00144690DA|nr:putative proteasome subunit alpha type-7 [Daldinia childiae]KAF3066523.1 putative proteasome subunit alpha type-7 [Daldinia childiae]